MFWFVGSMMLCGSVFLANFWGVCMDLFIVGMGFIALWIQLEWMLSPKGKFLTHVYVGMMALCGSVGLHNAGVPALVSLGPAVGVCLWLVQDIYGWVNRQQSNKENVEEKM